MIATVNNIKYQIFSIFIWCANWENLAWKKVGSFTL